MADLDPQVQIRLIEIAWKYAEGVRKDTGRFANKDNLEVFDHAYKSLLKTVPGE